MPVDCPLIFRRKHHGIEIKLNKESEEVLLKKFKVTLTGHYQKTISVYAETPEQVKEKTETILFDTDLIDFSDEDFIGGEAAITVDREDDLEESVEWSYVKKKYKLNMPFLGWLTLPKLLLFPLTLHNTPPHIDQAKDIHNDCGSALYYKMFRYIQIPTYMHAGS